ncbi:MAG: DUF5703 domain-containing protein, partial [Chitinophagaceae bacterium]|nr:DUF5703 domain-containing protein [Chitinophagaceae bacterium]
MQPYLSRFWILFFLIFCRISFAQVIDDYNIVWTSQSKNAGESMPCGGGDIGLNVWTERDEILFYLSRSGAFDENNVFPKLGRVRLRTTPNVFAGAAFRQELKLKDGYVEISTKKNRQTTTFKIWVDVHSPIVHVDWQSTQAIQVEAVYENWRFENLEWTNPAQTWASLAYRDAPFTATIYSDSIAFHQQGILWYHRNRDYSVFDFTVQQQGLDSVKPQLWNPLKNLTFGGYMWGANMQTESIESGRYADTKYKGYILRSKQRKTGNVSIALHIDKVSAQQQ